MTMLWQISRHVTGEDGTSTIGSVEVVEGNVAAVNARLEALIAQYPDATFSAGASPGSEPPPAPPPPPPDAPSNSDWRVGLILWGRFADVEAKVTAARDSGSIEGQIIWQRWEYANHVFRAELMQLRETFGFTAEEVEESLVRAAAVAAAARAA